MRTRRTLAAGLHSVKVTPSRFFGARAASPAPAAGAPCRSRCLPLPSAGSRSNSAKLEVLAKVDRPSLVARRQLLWRTLLEDTPEREDVRAIADVQGLADLVSTPMPRLRRLPICFWRSPTAMGSTPANGSSNRMNFGLGISDRAISVRRRSPPERVSPSESRTCCRPNSSRSDSARRFCSSLLMPLSPSSAAWKFWRTVSLRKTDASCGR